MSQHVELVGYYGSDAIHALSAWTSTSRELTDERAHRIGALLKMLARDGHHTPFEKSLLHFVIRVDTATHIQLLKHRIGVSVNGESARYRELREATMHIPDDWPDEWATELQEHYGRSRALYADAIRKLEPVLGRKRAKESARFFLPYANQLTLDVSFNFRSFAHFVGLRAAEDAQQEIRDVTDAMVREVRATAAFDRSLDAFNLRIAEAAA